MTDIAKLQAVAAARYRGAEALTQFRAAADTLVETQMEPWVKEIEEAVMNALDDGFSVIDVARAYTVSGKTPNRNVIHAIKRKYTEDGEPLTAYPFRWVARTTNTARGIKKVYDIYADVENFGPEEITGTYSWVFDRMTGKPEEIRPEGEPYPNDPFYERALSRWIMMNPYPEDGEA